MKKLTPYLIITLALCTQLLLHEQSRPWAQEGPVVTLSTTVTGNQEQPKVLYIVPWQAAEDNTLLYQALNRNSADNIFGHVERSEHRREIQFLGETGAE